jgi:DNA-binding transcriptional LysR family regulator
MTPLIILFASLSAASAGGIRLGLPLLLLVFMGGAPAENGFVHFLTQPFMFGILLAWTLVEVVASKTAIGQRVVRLVQFGLTPVIAGTLAAAFWSGNFWAGVGVVLSGSLLASVLQLVQSGFLFRIGPLPLWASVFQDVLCGLLVVLACYAPSLGAGLGLLLLVLALRQAQSWRKQFKLRLAQNQSTPPLVPKLHECEIM